MDVLARSSLRSDLHGADRAGDPPHPMAASPVPDRTVERLNQGLARAKSNSLTEIAESPAASFGHHLVALRVIRTLRTRPGD
jgi:hypothetical protein